METLISGSLKPYKRGGSLRFNVNLKSEHIKTLDLDNRKHAELTFNAERQRYRLKFYEKATLRSKTVSLNTNGGGVIAFDPRQVKLDNHDQSVAAVDFIAEYVGDSIEFAFDAQEFVNAQPKYSALKHKQIETPEEKVAAGFNPDSAWGVRVETEKDERIANLINQYMAAKYKVMHNA